MGDCPFPGCEGVVREARATEMPTVAHDDSGFATEFAVRYCERGHQIAYVDYQRPLPEAYHG